MNTILLIIDAISIWTGKIFSFIAVISMFIIGYEVVARYGFNSPTIWSTEVLTYGCGIYYVMGGAFLLRFRGHVNVDAIYGLFSPRKRAILDLLTFPFVFIFLVVLIWTSADVALKSVKVMETTGTTANIPVYLPKMILPVATILLLLQGLANMVRDLMMAITGKRAE